MASRISYLFTRTLDLYRREVVSDGSGGEVSTWVFIKTVRCRVAQPVQGVSHVREQIEGGQAASTPYQPIYMDPTEPVYRGDELRGVGAANQAGVEEIYRVAAIGYPSKEGFYKRADTEFVQPEPPRKAP